MNITSGLRRGFLPQAVAAFAIATLIASAAVAQGGGGGGRGPRMSPEEQAKVWTIQAEGVAQELGLADDLKVKVVEAYKASRTKQGEALRAAMQDEANRGPGGLAKAQELNNTEREALKATLAGILTAEQADKAIATLGTFSRQWDSVVNALVGLGVDAEKQAKALPLLAAYATDVDAMMKKAMEAGDFAAVREGRQERKTKLDTDLGAILSAEELAKWKEATAMRGGGFGGGGGQGGGRRGGGEGGAAPAPAAPATGAAPASPAGSAEKKKD